MKTRLTKEEKEILESFEKGEWVPVFTNSSMERWLKEQQNKGRQIVGADREKEV